MDYVHSSFCFKNVICYFHKIAFIVITRNKQAHIILVALYDALNVKCPGMKVTLKCYDKTKMIHHQGL